MYAAHGLIHANMITFPTVLTLARHDYDSWFVLGALATASAMTFGALGLPAGFLTDRIGSRRVVLLSLSGSALACFVAGFGTSLPILGAGLVLLGAFGGFYHPSALTLITTSLERSGKALGMHGVGGNVGMAAAPLALGAFAAYAGWHAAFFLMGAFGLVFAAAAARFLPRPSAAPSPADDTDAETHPARERESGDPQEPLEPTAERAERSGPDRSRGVVIVPLLLTYTVILTLGFVYNGFIAFLPSYLTEGAPSSLEGIAAGGALTTVVLLFGMAGQWWGGHMSETGRARPAFLAASVVVLVAGVLMWRTTGWMLVAAGSLLSILLFSGQPMGNSLLAEFTSARRRGLAFGVSFTLSFGVGSLATGALGYVADRTGLAEVFLALGLATLPAVLAAGALLVRSRPSRDGVTLTTTTEVRS